MPDSTQVCLQTTLLGILLNACLAAAKGIAGVIGHSYALIADAIESTSDIASSLIVYGGLKIASIPPDEDHPYGHGKAEPLAAMLVAFALLTAALAIIIQSIREIQTPHHAPAPFTLYILIGVVIVKESLYRYVINVGDKAQSTAVITDAWHHRSDAITSAATGVGIAIALICGPGYEAADDWAALLASGIIILNAIRLLRPALAEVMDAAPGNGMEQQVRDAALAVRGVTGLDVCNVRKMGLHYYVDLHVLVDGDLPVRDGHEIAHRVKDAIRKAQPRIHDILIHIEPTEAHPA
ncbi:MAG: cation transporter [Candidatus Omnitrophica bacterium]|nr:cation transporter [Candidatus Omnitrophota bacterium]MCE7907390.1 cation transporter [Candidatus Omnitrophica bacterium COP1]